MVRGTDKDGRPIERLIGIGWVNTKPASEFKVGDTIAFNYGYTATISSISKRGNSIYWDIVENGKHFKVRKLPTSQVPYYGGK